MRSARRRLRHWKQRYDKDAKFVWNKYLTWNGKRVEPGEPVPDKLLNDSNRLRRFWEARVVQLEGAWQRKPLEENVEVESNPEDLVKKHGDRKWEVQGLDTMFYTKKAAIAAATELMEEDDSDGDDENPVDESVLDAEDAGDGSAVDPEEDLGKAEADFLD